MKTYDENYFGYKGYKNIKRTWTNHSINVTHCTCIFWYNKDYLTPMAYKNCKNCFGRGVVPLSWSELKTGGVNNVL